MKNLTDKKFLSLIAVFLFATLITWNSHFKEYFQADTVDIHKFPKHLGTWTAAELTISEEEYAILETRNVFARRYTDDTGRTADLLIVYSQHNRKVSHPPEICYTGGGITILSNLPAAVKVATPPGLIRANKLLLEKKKTQHLSYYWFKVGNTFTSNYWKQQLLIVTKTLLGQPSGSALIRVSSGIQDGEQKTAEQNISDFIRVITPQIPQYLP